MDIWKERSPWMVLVAACWVEATSGASYAFSTYSASLKSELGYDQRQINVIAAAKDFGDHVGLAAGFFYKFSPRWAVLLVGAGLTLGGYGYLWLLARHSLPTSPFWLVCIVVFIGTNGLTYLDTAALLTCLSCFSTRRAMIVGLLKGFKGLSGAIFDQVYAGFLAPNQTSFILLIALGPALVVVPLIFIMGSKNSSKLSEQNREDKASLTFGLLYGAAVLLATYMLIVTMVQDLGSVSNSTNIGLTIALFLILLLPPLVPQLAKLSSRRHQTETTNHLLAEKELEDDGRLLEDTVSSVTRPADEENWWRALGKANFWLLVLSIFLSMGSATTAFDNLAQIAQAQGYEDTQVFVSMSNIWNFMGRLAGGYVSEVSTRGWGHPRAVVLAAAQLLMVTGHALFATALPGTMYAAVFCVATGYGAQWAVFPTAVSELFGLESFAVLYNVVAMACPAGSLIYSTAIAGPLYDRHAEEQGSSVCKGAVCFETAFFIMGSACVVAAAVSMALAVRTRLLYLRKRSC